MSIRTEVRIVWADGKKGQWQRAEVQTTHALQEYARNVNRNQGKGGWKSTAKVEFR
jgi:hypothetical protein